MHHFPGYSHELGRITLIDAQKVRRRHLQDYPLLKLLAREMCNRKTVTLKQLTSYTQLYIQSVTGNQYFKLLRERLRERERERERERKRERLQASERERERERERLQASERERERERERDHTTH